jgi:FixJ family two-component response regulator
MPFLSHSHHRLHLPRPNRVSSPLIAIIDDDEVLRSSLVDLLRSSGYRAEEFASAEKFLASNLLHYDCVIADVQMPGMNGLDLVRKLRGRGDPITVILMTALPDLHLDDEALSAGALCLVRKPFGTNSLLDRIELSLADQRR